MEIADISKKLNVPIDLDPGTLTIVPNNPEDLTAGIVMKLTLPAAQTQPAQDIFFIEPPPGFPSRNAQVQIIDARNQKFTMTLSTSGDYSHGLPGFVSPIRMNIVAPAKDQPLVIPVDLKDIPLPEK